MRTFLLIFIVSFTHIASFSQVQVGVFGGLANYMGDLESKFYPRNLTKPALGLTVRYELTDRIVLRGGYTYAKLAGADRYSSKQSLRNRNLSFETALNEFSAVAEVHTFRLYERRWSPYVFGGLAVYHYNPYAFDANNDKVFLKPLSTEGQGLPGYTDSKPYALTQLALPFGGGLRFDVTDRIIVSAEMGLRKLFTDHLDDVSGNYADAGDLFDARGVQAVALAYRGDEVAGGDPLYPQKGSQRGSARQKDWYYFTGLHLAFRLGAGNGGSIFGGGGGGKRSGYGCPANPM